MEYFVESPVPALVFGIVGEVVLAFFLVRTGLGKILYAMAAVLAIAGGMFLLQWAVVTERERVIQTMDAIVVAVEANNLDQTLSYLAPEAAETQRRVRWAMNRFEFTKARFANVEIQFDSPKDPKKAEARFGGMLQFRDRAGESPYGAYSTPFTAQFRKENGRWLVTGHSEKDMQW